jgi:ribosomal protein S18 acetylase RimI-like enzyme
VEDQSAQLPVAFLIVELKRDTTRRRKRKHPGVDAMSRLRNGPYVEVFSLVVAAAHRRRGLAESLLRHAEAYTRHTWPEARQLRLHVLNNNVAAHLLYTKLGFHENKMKHGYPAPGFASLRMVKMLE